MMRKVRAEVVDMSLQRGCSVIKVNNHAYDIDRLHVWKVTFRKDMELESDEYSGCYKFLRMYIFMYNTKRKNRNKHSSKCRKKQAYIINIKSFNL